MKSIRVKDYMRSASVCFRAEMPVELAVQRMLDSDLFGVPVVDDTHHLIGYVSEQEVLAKELEGAYLSEPGSRIGDLMRTDVLTVEPDTSIIELAQMIAQGNKPKIYPVVDEFDRVVGIITRREVLKAISQQPMQFSSAAG